MRARAGPPDDLARFYAAEYEGVRRTLVLFTSHRGRGEALAREVFVRTGQHWDVVRSTGAPRTWVHRQAIELAIANSPPGRGGRQGGERSEAGEIEVVAIEPPLADEEMANALGELDADERSVVLLRWAADLSVDEVAEVLGVSVDSVEDRGRRGLATLRDLGIEVPHDDDSSVGPVEERSPWAPIDEVEPPP